MPKKVLLFSLGIFLLLAAIYSLIEPRWIEEKHFQIKSSQIPPEFSGKKIVFLTDIHCGLFFSEQKLDRLVARANALKPDIILLGGDYADGDERYFKQVARALGELKAASTELIGVLGNHDYSSSGKDISPIFAAAGIKILRNENLRLGNTQNGQRLFIAGIEDLNIGWPNLESALSGIKDEDYAILLSHNPDVSEEAKTERADLIVSGHTHGGQITFFGLWAPITMSNYGQKYVSGLSKTTQGKTITSNGLGTVALPLRFFARPQIVILDLENAIKKEIALGGKKINAEIAETESDRRNGLMGRKDLCPECGMLFIFASEEKHSFWMKNTLIPLDMIFINKDKKVVDIKKAEPCEENPCQAYTPLAPATYVLEVPLGTFSSDLIGQSASFD